jgi:hypothetical protein
MGVYGLELVMDPVQLTSCTLTLVQNVGSFLGVNIDTLTLPPQTYEICNALFLLVSGVLLKLP